ncbi:DUF294 nucleotidyltransferase-like domain-containing protein [Gracilibacillus sp. YIM 98692]|uniref:DUF294 nucleotidyltransferase-like domain-containing protein n=1 Tax=Gracilibacillus sp. YIM 98692 TaxID=2663532 RepID=UPI001F09C8BE|nr:DUF294 nucleotidyltransferase-like domain-containing protein [Gracilibacillus sp. YIM 98692]
MNNYEEIKQFREQYIKEKENAQQLNAFHDKVMEKTVHVAMEKVEREQGQIPAPFAFFIMGSAGRQEQSVWSDQDHGIIFEGDEQFTSYFLTLGEEIVHGLEMVGYQKCDGKVMASEPMWTKTRQSWEKKIHEWLDNATWQSLRHFSTFFDSRVLIGNSFLLSDVKQVAFEYLEQHVHVYERLIDNVDFIRKGIGIFGQLLPEQSGEMSGRINIKTTTIFPYVNALRLLALVDKCEEASTAGRFQLLKNKYPFLQDYEEIYLKLLKFKHLYTKDAKDYDEVHHVAVKSLRKRDKQELKSFMKNGSELFQKTKKQVEIECSKW